MMLKRPQKRACQKGTIESNEKLKRETAAISLACQNGWKVLEESLADLARIFQDRFETHPKWTEKDNFNRE